MMEEIRVKVSIRDQFGSFGMFLIVILASQGTSVSDLESGPTL